MGKHFSILTSFCKFVVIPFRSSGLEEHFDKKVLLKLSSTFKLRNFDIGMDKAISSHTFFFIRYLMGINS